MTCEKRGYPSAKQARVAHRHMGSRIRPYICHACGRWHVTNADKHAPERVPLARKGRR